MGKYAVFVFWEDGSFDLHIEKGKENEIIDKYEHNQNGVFTVELTEFLKKLKENDIIKYMHEEHIF